MSAAPLFSPEDLQLMLDNLDTYSVEEQAEIHKLLDGLEESAQVEALEHTAESEVPEQDTLPDSLDEIALGYSSEKISCLIPGLEQPHFLCILQRKDKD